VLRELAPTDLVLSSQVLSEFYVATTRPDRRLLTTDRAREVVTSMSWTTVEAVDSDLVRRAPRIHKNQPRLSYWGLNDRGRRDPGGVQPHSHGGLQLHIPD
jgi:hypothetical protein